MLERAETLLKLVCAGLAAWLLMQGIGTARRLDPLTRTSVPEPPTWTPPTAPTPPSPAAGMPMAVPMPPGMPLMGRPPRGGAPGPALPPETETRVDRIVQGGLLGPVIRPPPMALLGIAGQDVLFRAPNGQSGLVREGGELGGVRILRIGTNRVLIAEGTNVTELTIFEGMGGESLLPKQTQITP